MLLLLNVLSVPTIARPCIRSQGYCSTVVNKREGNLTCIPAGVGAGVMDRGELVLLLFPSVKKC